MKKVVLFIIAVCVSMSVWSQTASDYRSKAEQGDANAQDQLAACYDSGDGVVKDGIPLCIGMKKHIKIRKI